MHSSVEVEPEPQESLLELGLLITEGRRPNAGSAKGFEEGPHCLRNLQKGPRNHVCTAQNHLCVHEESFRKHVDVLWRNNVPLCIEVLLCSDCPCGKDKAISPEVSPLADPFYILLEQWTITSSSKRVGVPDPDTRGVTNGRGILHAVRSFLHFSQLSAWFALSKGESPKNVMYRVTIPGENFVSKFTQSHEDHEFPSVQFKSHVMKVSVKSIPRLGSVPTVSCSSGVCATRPLASKRSQSPIPVGEIIRGGEGGPSASGLGMSSSRCPFRHSAPIAGNNRVKQKQVRKEIRNERMREYMNKIQSTSPSSSRRSLSSYLSYNSDEGPSTSSSLKMRGHLNFKEVREFYPSSSSHASPSSYRPTASSSATATSPEPEDECDIGRQTPPLFRKRDTSPRTRQIPTLSEKIDFLKSLDTAATRLFHRKTGLPLTSSPAPLRKGQDRFDFDSSLVSATKFISRFRRGCHPPRFSEATRALLGSFEESVLNGRIEPVSTVQGFTAEIGASGSFCPRHIHLPVTVFFYTFRDNDKISTPYLAHVDLGEQGYCVPRKGTVQVTLFNPLRTVIKMFVVQFNLETMPNNSQTFLRQRTYLMPLGESDSHPSAQKWLRYLIHLRFASNDSGQIFLHTDMRMVIFRKSDADTATGFDVQSPHELRSFTYSPHNPQFSPRFLASASPDEKKDLAKPSFKKNKKSARKKLTFEDDAEEIEDGIVQAEPLEPSCCSSQHNLQNQQNEENESDSLEEDEECQQEFQYDFINHSEVEIIV